MLFSFVPFAYLPSYSTQSLFEWACVADAYLIPQ